MIPDITSPPIIVPSGKCPHRLDGLSDDDIVLWVKKLRRDVSSMLTVRALRYWVRHTYEVHTDEHDIACEKINDLIEEPQGHVSFS